MSCELGLIGSPAGLMESPLQNEVSEDSAHFPWVLGQKLQFCAEMNRGVSISNSGL